MEDKTAPQQVHHNPSTVEKVIGIIFAFLVFAMVAYTVIMDINIDDNKLPLLYTMIALMAGVMVATIPGFLNVSYSTKGVTVRAAGGVGAFVLVLSTMQEMSAGPNPVPAPLPNPVPNAVREEPSDWNEPSGADLPVQPVNLPMDSGLITVTSYCSMTGASGFATHQDVYAARMMAIQYCVAAGGIPECCANGINVVQ
ncbi:hypothetical protein R50073_29360 [Maricurvus nonylphenolicus]|uniref:hypothetical protein n=1 Tax=Maricurvus nonylphenolicus TaxID=1008307 RepID=UPI0036F372DE